MSAPDGKDPALYLLFKYTNCHAGDRHLVCLVRFAFVKFHLRESLLTAFCATKHAGGEESFFFRVPNVSRNVS